MMAGRPRERLNSIPASISDQAEGIRRASPSYSSHTTRAAPSVAKPPELPPRAPAVRRGSLRGHESRSRRVARIGSSRRCRRAEDPARTGRRHPATAACRRETATEAPSGKVPCPSLTDRCPVRQRRRPAGRAGRRGSRLRTPGWCPARPGHTPRCAASRSASRTRCLPGSTEPPS